MDTGQSCTRRKAAAHNAAVPQTARHVGRAANAARPRFGFITMSHCSAGQAIAAVMRIIGAEPAAAPIMNCADRKIGNLEKFSREIANASRPLVAPTVMADDQTAGNGAVGSAMKDRKSVV